MVIKIEITKEERLALEELFQIEKERFGLLMSTLEEYIKSLVLSLALNKLKIYISDEIMPLSLEDARIVREEIQKRKREKQI